MPDDTEESREAGRAAGERPTIRPVREQDARCLPGRVVRAGVRISSGAQIRRKVKMLRQAAVRASTRLFLCPAHARKMLVRSPRCLHARERPRRGPHRRARRRRGHPDARVRPGDRAFISCSSPRQICLISEPNRAGLPRPAEPFAQAIRRSSPRRRKSVPP